MPLENYQFELEKDTLYKVAAYSGAEQLQPSLQAKGGTATLYVSQDEPTGSPLTDDMIADDTEVDGIKVLVAVPRYILLTGTATSIIASGLQVEEIV